MMKFEDLANELLLDLFELLDAVHLLRAFYGLSFRFDTLLLVHFRAYRLDFRSVSKRDFNVTCQQHLPNIIDRVVSLHLSNEDDTPNLLQLFLSYHFTLDQFNHLQKLSLYHMRSLDTVNQIIIPCRHLTHLNLIKCNFERRATDVRYLINNIWSLRKLVHCHLDHIFINEILFMDIPIISQSIEYLFIKNMYCPLSVLFHLFKCTPRLRHLSAIDIVAHEDEQFQPVISSLSSMNISFSGLTHSMGLLFQNLPDLHHLTIHISSIYLNGYEWETIIVNHLPKIKVFRLKMEFNFPCHNNKEKQVDELLDSFRTQFWLEKHQWFVQYEFNPTSSFNHNVLYTLPYAFKEFVYGEKCRSKSTCFPDQNYWLYDRVETFRYLNTNKYSCKGSNIDSSRFFNIRHLKINLPFNDHFFTIIPSLYHLISLKITFSKDVNCSQLQALLDRAPHLYSLTVEFHSSDQADLFQIKNSSIRHLVFVIQGTERCNLYFTSAECAALTSLEIRCEVLSIDIKTRTIILDLINRMLNLRSLTVQCEDDKWNIWQSSSVSDELIVWLQTHLPSTYSITRNMTKMSAIQIWIDS